MRRRFEKVFAIITEADAYLMFIEMRVYATNLIPLGDGALFGSV